MRSRRPPVSSLFVSLLLLGCGESSAGREADGDAGDASAVCGGVSLEPFIVEPGSGRDDRGAEGLRALRAEAETAIARFDELSRAHDGHYTYRVRTASFTGDACETTFTVRAGKVVRRAQDQELGDAYRDAGVPEEDWVEEGESVGSHVNACHTVRTLDAVYAECLAVALCQDPRENLIYLERDMQGVLRVCGVAPLACTDDCYEGVLVKEVVFEPPPVPLTRRRRQSRCVLVSTPPISKPMLSR